MTAGANSRGRHKKSKINHASDNNEEDKSTSFKIFDPITNYENI